MMPNYSKLFLQLWHHPEYSQFSTNQMPPNLTLDLKNKNITGKFIHLHISCDPSYPPIRNSLLKNKQASFMPRGVKGHLEFCVNFPRNLENRSSLDQCCHETIGINDIIFRLLGSCILFLHFLCTFIDIIHELKYQ